MPTVFRERGYQFFFVSSDGGEPVHIHVTRGGHLCKIWLDSRKTAYNHGFKAHELREIARIVMAHEGLIEEKWHEHFSA
jgi:hypothetical protein